MYMHSRNAKHKCTHTNADLIGMERTKKREREIFWTFKICFISIYTKMIIEASPFVRTYKID